MRFFTARRLALAAFLPALLSVTFVPGCAQQGEGERCGDSVGFTDNDDCGSGLVCKQIDRAKGIYRCCQDGDRVTDSRCIPVTSSEAGAGGAAGVAGTAGVSGIGGNAGTGTGGVSGAAAAGTAGTPESAGAATDAGAGGV